MDSTYYREEQKFNPLMAWLIMFPVLTMINILFGIGLYQQLHLGKPWGNEPMTDTALIVVTLIMNLFVIGMLTLMLKIRFITEIRHSGLYFRYLPFIIRERKISREEIERFEVRRYKPVQEFGGWGIRQRSRRLRKSGIAYNVHGNIGLQLELKNGKKILFGTQRKEAIGSAMNKMMEGMN